MLLTGAFRHISSQAKRAQRKNAIRVLSEQLECRSLMTASFAAECLPDSFEFDDEFMTVDLSSDEFDAEGIFSFDEYRDEEALFDDEELADSSSEADCNVLEYSITTEDDIELYAAEITAFDQDVDSVATDDFLFELDAYLMDRFADGEDFALSSGLVEFFVVDNTTLDDFDSTGDFDGLLSVMSSLGLAENENPYDFLVVNGADGFQIYDIPDSSEFVSNFDSEFSSVITDESGVLLGADLSSEGVTSDNDNEVDNAIGLLTDSTTNTNDSDDDSLVAEIADNETLDENLNQLQPTDSVGFDFALTSIDLELGTNSADLIVDARWPASTAVLLSQQFALANTDGSDAETLALVASLLREYNGQRQANVGVGAGQQFYFSQTASPHGSDLENRLEAIAFNFKTNTANDVITRFTLADANDRSSLRNDTVKGREATDLDTAFSASTPLIEELHQLHSDNDVSSAESYSYSQIASAVGALIVAGSGCVKVSQRNGWWILWRLLRSSLLAALPRHK